MSIYIPVALRQQLLEADDHCCAYCQTAQSNSGYPMVIDHIIPRKNGGRTEFENLCYSCHRCNEFKGATMELEDPLTNRMVCLFNPRQQQWRDHFAWDDAGIHIVGSTAVGRVTIIALKLNNEIIINARQNWVRAGLHPVDDDMAQR